MDQSIKKNFMYIYIQSIENLFLRSYANKTMYVRYECNRRIHRAQFKFVKYQHNKMPVGLEK